MAYTADIILNLKTFPMTAQQKKLLRGFRYSNYLTNSSMHVVQHRKHEKNGAALVKHLRCKSRSPVGKDFLHHDENMYSMPTRGL